MEQATVGASDTTAEMIKNANGNTIALNQMTLGAKAASVGLKLLSGAGNMLISMGISLAISALIKGIDYVIHREEKLQAALDESISEFNETTEEIKSLEEQITSITAKIEELQKLKDAGTISISDEKELENLKEENDELARNLALKKAKQASKARDTLEDAKKTSDSLVSSKYSYDSKHDGSKQSKLVTRDEELMNAIKAFNSGDKSNSTSARIADMYEDISPTLDAYRELMDAGIELEGQDQKNYERLKKAEDAYMMYSYAITGTKTAFEGLTKEQRRNVLVTRLLENGLSEEYAKAIVNSIQDEDVNKFWNANFSFVPPLPMNYDSAEEYGKAYAEAWLNSIQKTVEKDTGKVDLSVDTYKTASESISSLATAFNELTDNEYISLETISKIKGAVGDSIANWDEYEQKLLSVKKGTAEYNQVMSELTYATLEKQLGGVNALAQADKKYIAHLLKENGVLNANEVAHNAVERAKAKEWVQSQANDNITDKNIKSLMTEAKTAGISTSAYLELTAKEILFNNNKISTQQKCREILAIAQAANVASTEYSTLESNINAWASKDLLGSGTRTKTAQDAGMTVVSEKNRKDKNHNGKGNLYIASDGKEFEKYEEAMYYQEALNNVAKISEAYLNINYVLPDYSDTTTSSFKETFNWIETALSRIQQKVTSFGKTVAATWQSWKVRNAALKDQMSAIRNEISLQDQAYSKYTALANSVGLSEGYKTLVREGAIDISTIKSESIAEAIKLYQEYYEKALAARDASADLKDELAALAQTKFSNLTQSFADLMSGNEHTISMYEATIDLMEKRGYTASASLYDSLKEAESKNQDILKEKYQSLSQALDEAVSSGAVVKYSEQWYQMQNEILSVEEAIIQSNIALAEYDNALRDLEWSAFDKLHEEISEIYEETEFLDKLLSNEKKYNENGSLTGYGQASLGLHAVNYKTHLAQAEEYAQELERIREDLANDPYNQTLLDREDELEEKLRESLTAIEDDEQAMLDTVSGGYDTLLDYMDKMINKRKDMLSQAKDLYEYEKNIAEQTNEITSIEKQLAAYQGDDSEEARATIQKLQVSLSEAKENLEETEYDKYISDQEEMLDTLRLQTEEWINARLDNEDQLLRDIVNSTEKSATEIKDTLTQVASSTGTTLSDAMQTIWSNDGDIGKAIADIRTYLAGMQKNAEEKAKEQVENNIPASSDSGTTTATASASSTSATTSATSWGDFFVKRSDAYPKNKLNTETSIVDRLKFLDYDSSFSARSQYYTAMGGSGIYTGSSSQNRWMIDQMKAHSGFARGGIIGDMIRGAGEDGIALVRRGEGIIPTNMVPEWNALIHHLPQLNHSMLGSIGQHSQKEVTNIGDINVSFELPNVQNYSEFMTQMQNDINFERMIQDMTLGVALGGHSMKKYQYKW